MEITPQVAQTMIDERFHEFPQFGEIARSEKFRKKLTQILEFEELDKSLLLIIEREVTLVLALYVPLHELAQNIQESTELPSEKAEEITNLVETLIFEPVYNDLLAFDRGLEEELKKVQNIPEANKELKEKLELRPESARPAPVLGDNSKPLTREEVLNALAPRRTMMSDIASIQKSGGEVQGYEAYQDAQKTSE